MFAARLFPLLLAMAAAVLLPPEVRAQSGTAGADPGTSDSEREFTLDAPSGERITFPESRVLELLERTRRLGKILEEDPDVLYYVGVGPEVSIERTEPAYPWTAVRVRSDSVARIATPANYREADRAYQNYAVRKMRYIREAPPAAECETVVEREVELVSIFIDGWIVTRLLFGGPAYPPLDAFVFARDAGHLPAMLVALEDSELQGCIESWKQSHPGVLEAFRRWYDDRYLGDVEGPIPGGEPERRDPILPPEVPIGGGSPVGAPDGASGT